MAGISAILLAAGESSRMGSPKALLSWADATLIEYQTSSLLAAGVTEVMVVLGHGAAEVTPYISGPAVRYVVNNDYRLGKTTSIKAGLRAVDAAADDVLLLAVDQPRTPEIVAAVVRSHVESRAAITSPRYRGHGGHPMVFSAKLRGELAEITEAGLGVREVIEHHRDEVSRVEIDNPMIRLDLNTPDDYREAMARYAR